MKSVYIIAEAGVNHNGDINIAKNMIDAAFDAGVDAVKFQTFCPEEMVSRFAQKADYQIKTTGDQQSQLEMLRQLQLSREDHLELVSYCEGKGIQFLSTPFDLPSLELLQSIGVPILKVSSGEVTNLPFLIAVARCNKPVIISSGMSTLLEIREAVNILQLNGAQSVTVLHCNTEYPTPFEDVNLRAMYTIAEELQVSIGYSDHTNGIEVPIAAVAMGAKVIEKHFTLDRTMQGPDHKASLEPLELKHMVESIRKIEQALGTGLKVPTKSEIRNRDIARKSIVAARDIMKGEVFSTDNITTKRPGNGISPMQWNEVIGGVAIRDFHMDELIEI